MSLPARVRRQQVEVVWKGLWRKNETPDNKLYTVTLINAGAFTNAALFTTAISKQEWLIPGNFILHQNYPNPFNPATYIKFDITKASYVMLTIYNILGKEITTLVNEKLNAGSYEVVWNATSYTSGVYFYWIKTGEFLEINKMIILK